MRESHQVRVAEIFSVWRNGSAINRVLAGVCRELPQFEFWYLAGFSCHISLEMATAPPKTRIAVASTSQRPRLCCFVRTKARNAALSSKAC